MGRNAKSQSEKLASHAARQARYRQRQKDKASQADTQPSEPMPGSVANSVDDIDLGERNTGSVPRNPLTTGTASPQHPGENEDLIDPVCDDEDEDRMVDDASDHLYEEIDQLLANLDCGLAETVVQPSLTEENLLNHTSISDQNNQLDREVHPPRNQSVSSESELYAASVTGYDFEDNPLSLSRTGSFVSGSEFSLRSINSPGSDQHLQAIGVTDSVNSEASAELPLWETSTCLSAATAQHCLCRKSLDLPLNNVGTNTS